MGGTIDDKVVAMSFESSKFESGVHSTISSLDKLKAALHFPGAGKGLEDISSAAKRVDLSHIGHGIDEIKNKFSALSVAGLAVIASLATAAARAGINFAKAFTIDPIKAGFHEYATNLNAVQTILANTQAAGVGLKEVNATLDELNAFSDKTIYNFGQMARNIGTFTAAGVDLDTATASIKGIADLAALSGSNADQAATAMYQLSQAISAGRVGLQDWNSVVNAGMGGTVFQRALATTAENMGTLKEGTLKLVGPMKNVEIAGQSFRQSMQAGPGKTSWLTSKVLTNTLKQFTGDLTDAELKAQGFNDAQIKSIQLTAKTAMHAATEVKTIAQVFDVAKETAGSGWAQTFKIIFGDFEEAKSTFTDLSNTINGFINANADARNKVLGAWKAMGGRTVLIEGIQKAFHALLDILAPIKDAFRDIFPATTGKDLFNLTLRFWELTDAMKPSPQTVENLRRTFRGLFAVLDIGKQIISGIFTVFKSLFGAVSDGQGSFLNFTGGIGDWLVALDKALKKGDAFHNFFVKIGAVLAKPVELLRRFAEAIGDLFGKFSPGGFSDQMGEVTDSLSPLERILDGITRAWNAFTGIFQGSSFSIQKMLVAIGDAISGIGVAIGHAASNMNFEAILAVIRTGLFAGLVLMFKQFLGRGSFLQQISKGFGGGVFKNLSGAFGSLTGSMKSMQTAIKAKTLKDIAIAIGILAASVLALSFVDPDRLKSSLTAITVMFAQLLGAMAILEKITATGGFLKLPFIIGSLIGLAVAIDLLTVAVFALSRLSWEELAKGLGGVAVLLGAVSAAAIPLSANSAGMIRASIGIGAIAASLLLLTAPVKIMGSMDLVSLGKGLGGVASGLLLMTFAMTKMPPVPLKSTVGLLAMASALVILAGAIKIMGSMDLQSLGKGLGGMAAGLILMTFAMTKMPAKSMLRNAAGLVLMATAMRIMADAILKMGGMSLEEMAHGLGTLAGALFIMTSALYAMEGAIPGAVALGIVAAGMAILAPALVKMGDMSWREIIKSLVTLAGALTVMAVAAVALSPAIPAMLGLGAALVLIGGGLALAGAGIFLVGAGLSAIAIAGPAAVGILVAALIELENGMVKTAKNLILGLLEIVEAFAATAPKFVDAMLKIGDALLDGIAKFMPKIVIAFGAIITAALQILHNNQGKIIQAGFDLLVALLQGIKNNIPQLTSLVADIIVRFINALNKDISRIVNAGSDLLVAFIKGIGQHIANVATAVGDIIVRFIRAVTNKLDDIITAGADMIVSLIKGITKSANDIVTAGKDAIISFVTGIGKAARDIVAAAVTAMGQFINALVTESLQLIDTGALAIINFLNGVADAIDLYEPEMLRAGARVGIAIVRGMINGMGSLAGELYNKAGSMAHNAVSGALHVLHIKSPSLVFHKIGQNIVAGLINGIDADAPKSTKAAEAMSLGVINTVQKTLGIRSPSKVMIEIGKAVGQGFAEGLRGSRDDIKSAFKDLNETLTDAITEAQETIKEEQDKLDEARKDVVDKQNALNALRADKKSDASSIKDALDDLHASQATLKEIQAVIAENKDNLEKTTAAHIVLTQTLQDEKKTLLGLAREYEVITSKLEAAQTALDTIRQARKDIKESTTSQFGTLPELDTTAPADIANAKKDVADALAKRNELMAASEQDAQAIADAQLAVNEAQSKMAELLKGKTLDSAGNSVDQLATYEDALKHQTTAINVYNATLQQLRKLGLDDAQYKKLVDDGVADQAFANQLLSGGRKAVEKLNDLDAGLQFVSKRLGTNVGKNMFDAGVLAAAKVVAGLERDKQKNRQQFSDIGHEMMDSLKLALTQEKTGVGDKMEEIGHEMINRMRHSLGMKSPSREMMEIGSLIMEGLALGVSKSTKLVTDATNEVVTVMKSSMMAISDAIVDEVNPVITPILDLTTVRIQARELSNLVPITAAASFGQASIISAQQQAVQTEQADTALAGTAVTLQQNNYSPSALSEIEIYRQTKNQLSQLKTILEV